MKTGSILMYFDVIFPMQLSEFIKSVNFGTNLLKVLEPIECRQADPYMTANRNFVRFAHS